MKRDSAVIVECTQFAGDGNDTQVFINGILVEKSPYLVK